MFFQIKDLSKRYGKVKALNSISFDIKAGEIVALIGKNGAGKTTLLNCIAGNIKPDTGNILYKDISLSSEDLRLNEFGILIQAKFFDYLNAYDNLVLLMRASGFKDRRLIKSKVDSTLALVGLEEKKKSYVKNFSFGQKQRLGLAQTLLHDPQFLILDEPFVGLDPIGKQMLKKVITQKAKDKNVGVLFSSHDLYDVSDICDRIIMFNDGEKVFDDIFLYKKTYTIILGKQVSKQIKVDMLRNFEEKIDIIDDDRIEFVEANLLDDILKYLLISKIKILDIQIRENSLYDFFESEV